jgi:hypothetical protein
MIFWGSFAATFAAFILTIYSIYEDQGGIQVFTFLSTFIENLLFLLGAAYFVAGSYPDGVPSSLHQEQQLAREQHGISPTRVGNGAATKGGRGSSLEDPLLAQDEKIFTGAHPVGMDNMSIDAVSTI